MTDAAARFSVADRTALVTGASRGIGRATAVALAEAGADVVCVSSRTGGCSETAAAVRASGRQAWELAADAANRDELSRMADDAERLADSIDILVNNAGTIHRQPAADYPMEKWDLIIRTNLDSVFLLCQRFGREMIARRYGKIVNVASLLSFSGGITVPAYTASKHAVAGLTKALANEWAASGVQVNAVAPGYIRTDNTQALRDDPVRSKELLARIPAHRWGEPEDIASAVVFLASPASDYMNGHVLVVDGGWMAR
jgi:2-deoxy-D-gluconate 3-dehydrogenase